MKNFMIVLTVIVGLVMIGCTESDARGPYNWGQEPVVDPVTLPVSGMTEEQKASLLFMYQEEKVARDVYITLGKVYPNERTFENIVPSEQKHMDAVEKLCVKYGVDISGVNEEVVGEFVLLELQELYNTMVIQGQESLLDALKVGEAIEIKDITDLEEAAVGMPSDVQKVFMNLRDGSLNHLSAFQNAIRRASR